MTLQDKLGVMERSELARENPSLHNSKNTAYKGKNKIKSIEKYGYLVDMMQTPPSPGPH